MAPTKTKRRHSVELSTLTYDTLIALHEDDSAGFVFSHDGGVTAWKPNRVTKTFIRYRRAAGCREFRFHDLRHFMATEMLNAGIPLPVVARRLDHQRPSTTLNFYAQAVPGGDAHAAATLEAVLASSDRSSTSAAVEIVTASVTDDHVTGLTAEITPDIWLVYRRTEG